LPGSDNFHAQWKVEALPGKVDPRRIEAALFKDDMDRAPIDYPWGESFPEIDALDVE
jgi:hypothetical protein